MKRSELDKLIKEELVKVLKEAVNIDNEGLELAVDYRGPEQTIESKIQVVINLQNLFPIDIAVDVPLSSRLKKIFTASLKDYKIGEKDFKQLEKVVVKDVKTALKPVAKKFESDVKKLVKDAITKHNK